MKILKNMKKTFAILSIVALGFTMNIFTNDTVDASLVTMSTSPLSTTVVEEGGSINFTLTYDGDVKSIALSEASIATKGFTSNISIKANGNNRIVTLSNIKDDGASTENRVYITGGTAVSSDGKLSNSSKTQAFTIKDKVAADTQAPVATITGPNPNSIYAGETVKYTITYSDNVGIASINLTNNSLKLVGFTANISISGTGNTRTVTLTNVQGTLGSGKYILVAGGTAVDKAGNLCNSLTGNKFSIVAKPVENKPVENKPVENKPTENKPVENKPTENKPVENKPSDWVANPNTGK